MSTRAEHTRESLLQALYRLERGRGRIVKDGKLSIAAVAREAGVSSALIHNRYPDVADQINIAKNKAYRAQRDAKVNELKRQKDINRELRAEIAELYAKLAKSASVIAALTAENDRLAAIVSSENTIVLPQNRG
ncbi:hypothetical protein [Thiocystis violacea]|uniref:hypothetical protein n=1 Tax=Thiocystis violacea TaxID=13725 RepID=UPI0019087F69|nr:hypothetical protein [Thiocystis violacea]MBK1724792.1 hypothetical protein [Thiocystis violacea]